MCISGKYLMSYLYSIPFVRGPFVVITINIFHQHIVAIHEKYLSYAGIVIHTFDVKIFYNDAIVIRYFYYAIFRLQMVY